jgi:hypothetical protein
MPDTVEQYDVAATLLPPYAMPRSDVDPREQEFFLDDRN